MGKNYPQQSAWGPPGHFGGPGGGGKKTCHVALIEVVRKTVCRRVPHLLPLPALTVLLSGAVAYAGLALVRTRAIIHSSHPRNEYL